MLAPPLVKVDVVIIGSGLQALCLLKELVNRNYTAVLLSKGELGGGQTAHSHAFLHEGHMFRRADNIKYTQESQRDWQEYLRQPEAKAWEGDFYFGDIEKEEFNKFYVAWEAEQIPNLGDINAPPPPGFAPGLKYWKGRGVCLATGWIVKGLSRAHKQYIGLTNRIEIIESTPTRVVIQAENPSQEIIQVEARRMIAAAGTGNHGLIRSPIPDQARQQTVQAHMLLVRASEKSPADLAPIAGFFRPDDAHRPVFIAPRIQNGRTIWLISDGTRIMANPDDLCKNNWPEAMTSEWVNKLMIPLSKLHGGAFGPGGPDRLEWAVHCAAKAERRHPQDKMPEGPEHCCIDDRSICVVWPTLLTHIPRMGRQIAEKKEWLGNASFNLTTGMPETWSNWQRQPGIAVENWRNIQFQPWWDFKARYGLH